VLIVATTLAAYANGFTGRFAGLDARESIRDNPHIQHLWPLSEAMSLQLLSSTKAADEGSKGGTVVRRPILSLSFALNYAATGLRPDGFHAVNVAIHLCAGLLLFGIVRPTLGRPPYAEHFGHSADWVALATALLWTVHPLQTESVTYIVQRAESLMGLFFLVTVYAAVRSFDSPRPAPWHALAAVSSALGMATKEVAAVAPVIVLLYDTTFVSRSVRGALASHRRLYVALFATWGVLVGLMLMTLDDVGSDFSEGRNLSYALAQPTVILHYLRAALWPHPLHLYVNTTLYDALGARQIAAAGVVVAALACATLWGVVRRTWLGFVGAWFFLILAPSSSIVAVSDVVQEHRMYLSLAAVVLLVVIAAYEILRRTAGRAAAPMSALLAVGCVLVLATLTHARNRDYHSEFAMIHPADLYEAYEILGNHYTLGNGDPAVGRKEAEDALTASVPGSPDYTYGEYLLGLLADKEGRSAEAAQHFERALTSDPAFGHAAAKLGTALLALDDPQHARDAFARAVEREPASAELHLGLGRALLAIGDVPGARTSFERVVAIDPNLAAGRNNLGFVLERLGDRTRAETEYRAALALDPDMVIAHRNLASALAADGNLAESRSNYERTVALEPDETPARIELAGVCQKQGDLDCAETHLREAARLAPDDAQVLSTLGAVLEQRGRGDEARKLYERAVALEPDHRGARNALGTLLAREGRFDEAAPQFERVLRSDPNNVDAHSNLGAVYAAQGRVGEAVDHLRAVLRLDPRHRAVNFNLGLLFEGQGDLETAASYYDRELEIDPSFEAAKRNRDRIRARLAEKPASP